MTIHTRELMSPAPPEGKDGVWPFTAATERPVRMFDPERGEIVLEVLPMSGCDLTRYRQNPVVLDAHRRGGTEFVAGRAERTDIEGGQLAVDIRFTKATPSGQRNLALVEDGSLRSLSIGYGFTQSREVGRDAATGLPIVERTAWELIEVSTAPVPADPDALLRAYQEANRMATSKKAKKADDDKKPEDEEKPEDERAEDPKDDEDEDEEKGKKADGDDERSAAPVVTLEAELAQAIDSRRSLIHALTTDDEARALGERLLLEADAPHEVDVMRDIRPQLLAHLAKRMKPVGTPDTTTADDDKAATDTPKTDPNQGSAARSLVQLLRGRS